MADGDGVDMAPSSTRLMNFVSEEQLAEARRSRGARVDDGTAQRDRPLYEILKENKDKRDAEFNERFKHRPPKALDEDETEFLEKLEMSKRGYERQMADEEAQQLQSFQAAVAAQSTIVHEATEIPPVPKVQEKKLVGRKNPPARPLGMIIKVKPQAKKAKIDMGNLDVVKSPSVDTEKHLDSVKSPNGDGDKPHVVANTGLVSYSDDSEED
ncbi:uncharacterized protein LOC131312292 [Rhododendron vialii]|uniref:uncharacterized protein LOC131312292 n=1 Tax=Rhododendron vialii TaxID=182163 RepID=UPI0026602B74|nr:uncharacterized protein LOC131312292 [Rhododendron vialii]XP_058195934.1 uncharacterized protein LOC131312292 [Rhododendron vialii]